MSRVRRTPMSASWGDDESWEHLVLAFESKSPPRLKTILSVFDLELAARLCLLVVGQVEILTARSDEVAINVARRRDHSPRVGALHS